MKVKNLDIQPSKTFRIRNMSLDTHAAMRALGHRGTAEAVLITENAVKVLPEPVAFNTWDELIGYEDPKEIIPRKVGAMAWLTGDNPFIILTSSGNPFPFPDDPDTQMTYDEARKCYLAAVQSAIHSKGIAAASNERFALFIQTILAGICVIGATLTALSLLPKILERF